MPAIAALLRRRPPGWGALLLPLAGAWATATFLAPSMHEWMWPGRLVVIAVPAMVVATQRPKKSVTMALNKISATSTFRSCAVETNMSSATIKMFISATPLPTLQLRTAFARHVKPTARLAAGRAHPPDPARESQRALVRPLRLGAGPSLQRRQGGPQEDLQGELAFVALAVIRQREQ